MKDRAADDSRDLHGAAGCRAPSAGVGKQPWERPTLTPIGDVRQLVHGALKASGNADADGTTLRKQPSPG